MLALYQCAKIQPHRADIIAEEPNVNFCKPRMCWNFTFLQVQFSILCCDKWLIHQSNSQLTANQLATIVTIDCFTNIPSKHFKHLLVPVLNGMIFFVLQYIIMSWSSLKYNLIVSVSALGKSWLPLLTFYDILEIKRWISLFRKLIARLLSDKNDCSFQLILLKMNETKNQTQRWHEVSVWYMTQRHKRMNTHEQQWACECWPLYDRGGVVTHGTAVSAWLQGQQYSSFYIWQHRLTTVWLITLLLSSVTSVAPGDLSPPTAHHQPSPKHSVHDKSESLWTREKNSDQHLSNDKICRKKLCKNTTWTDAADKMHCITLSALLITWTYNLISLFLCHFCYLCCLFTVCIWIQTHTSAEPEQINLR